MIDKLQTPNTILLCNDDGFDAPGICALEDTLADLGEVWKIAPDCQRSGFSHALNFHEATRLKQVGRRSFMLSNGYPADCANIGIHANGFPDFDLIIGGINHGPNLGDDVHYSGTVAIARQAAIHNIQAIAISAVGDETSALQMNRISTWLKSWLQENFSSLRTRIVYNINYPAEPNGQKSIPSYPEICFCYQGSRVYKDHYVESDCNDEKSRTLKLVADRLENVSEERSDFEAIHAGNISITPLSTYTTDVQELLRWLPEPKKEKKVAYGSF